MLCNTATITQPNYHSQLPEFTARHIHMHAYYRILMYWFHKRIYTIKAHVRERGRMHKQGLYSQGKPSNKRTKI